MHVGEMLESKYLKASDLRGQRVKVTIGSVEMMQMNDGKSKPAMYFQGKKKGMLLNKTNIKTIARFYGDDTDAWLGRPLELFEAMVDFQGDTVPAIRVSVPQANTQAPLQNAQPPQQPNSYAAARSGEDSFTPPPQQQPPQQQPRSRINDEIPF